MLGAGGISLKVYGHQEAFSSHIDLPLSSHPSKGLLIVPLQCEETLMLRGFHNKKTVG